jgi:hypothetical protein
MPRALLDSPFAVPEVTVPDEAPGIDDRAAVAGARAAG